MIAQTKRDQDETERERKSRHTSRKDHREEIRTYNPMSEEGKNQRTEKKRRERGEEEEKRQTYLSKGQTATEQSKHLPRREAQPRTRRKREEEGKDETKPQNKK